MSSAVILNATLTPDSPSVFTVHTLEENDTNVDAILEALMLFIGAFVGALAILLSAVALRSLYRRIIAPWMIRRGWLNDPTHFVELDVSGTEYDGHEFAGDVPSRANAYRQGDEEDNKMN